MKNRNRKNTIGDWLPKLGATVKTKPFWTVIRDARGTHAAIDVCILVKQGETVIGLARLGKVARGADYPASEGWQAGSMAAMEAVRLVTDVAARDYTWLDARAVAGVNCALPWEVVQPKPPAWWRRLGRWLCFWRKRG